MATTYEDVSNVFASIFADNQVISDEIVYTWFKMALGEYELMIGTLGYNDVLKKFSIDLSNYTINVLAYTMKKFYQQRLVSLTNKRNNIITNDISLNGTDSSKSHMEKELEETKETICSYYNKIKTPAYYG